MILKEQADIQNQDLLNIPPTEIPWQTWLPNLRHLAKEDMPAARQAALLRLIWQESYLVRVGLMARVQALLGRSCFGSEPEITFFEDIAIVHKILAQAGHTLLCIHYNGWWSYYIEGRPLLDEHLQRLIAGSVAEVDPRQIKILRRLTVAQRFQQGYSMIQLAEQVATYRLRKREPHLNQEEAGRLARRGMVKSG